jgi:D-methionine transport system ATP-binding protein
VIEIQNVGKTYQTAAGAFQALRDIELTVRRGEVFGIIGRSGAGKSTLLRLLNLLERPTQGAVRIEGRDITQLEAPDLRRLRQHIGMVFQHFNLLSSRSVYENVRFPLRVAGELSRSQQHERVMEVLQLVGLTDQAQKYPRQLSGGQRQRVGVARALANRPNLLLCDEATSALDPETTQSILRLLLDINRTLGITIVLITHGMDVIRAVADRVAILDHGRLVELGDVIDVFLNPRHDTTRALLAESGVESESWRGSAAQGMSQSGRVLRLTYKGDAVALPVLSRYGRELGLDFSILQGSVGRIKDMPYGQLTISVAQEDERRVAQLLAALTGHGIHHEVLR